MSNDAGDNGGGGRCRRHLGGVVAVRGVDGNGSGADRRCCSKGVVVLAGGTVDGCVAVVVVRA